ncbi:MAG TPA: hypothetical protein VG013_37315 [Gemmataceae bacterium]|jgi:hypothetical protein|nr:hypothetical protein [Gemmataceae bacterium]
MDSDKQDIRRPLWVRLGLWGLPERATAWGFVWLCIALAAGSAIYGFWDARFFAGCLLVLAALWYWLAIRWMDQHDRWP